MKTLGLLLVTLAVVASACAPQDVAIDRLPPVSDQPDELAEPSASSPAETSEQHRRSSDFRPSVSDQPNELAEPSASSSAETTEQHRRPSYFLEPWLAENSEFPAGSDVVIENSVLFASSTDECPATGIFDSLADWLEVQLVVKSADGEFAHHVGFVAQDESPIEGMAALESAGPCLTRLRSETVDSFRAPAIDGVDRAVVLDAKDASRVMVLATTNDRILHVLLWDRSMAGSRSVEDWLTRLGSKGPEALAELKRCEDAYESNFDVLNGCTGIQNWPFSAYLRDLGGRGGLGDVEGATSLLLLKADDVGGTEWNYATPTPSTVGFHYCEEESVEGETDFLTAMIRGAQLENPTNGDVVFQLVGFAGSAQEAVTALDECAAASSRSGMVLETLPKGAVAGTLWDLRTDASADSGITVDLAFNNGVLLTMSVRGPSASIERVDELLAEVSSRLEEFDNRVGTS